jgi:[ribosomal protein S5]-alanine N-acetyltransferase
VGVSLHLGGNVIQTMRCNLTPLKFDDLENVVKLHTDVCVRQFLGGPVNEAVIRSEFPQFIASGATTTRWAIRSKADDAFVGIVSLGVHHDGIDTEVSYLLLPAWWSQGYGKESVQAVVKYALETLGLPRVIAETQSANIASCRLLERLGMRLERTVERFGAAQSIYITNIAQKVCSHVQSNNDETVI